MPQEEKLQSRFQQFFYNTGVGILIVDKFRQIVEVNQTLCEMMGYSENELVGNSAQMIHVDEDTFEQFRVRAFEKVRRNQPVNLEWRYRRKDGQIIWVRVAGDPVAGKEEVLWTLVDITKRIKAQEEIKKKTSQLEGVANQLSKYLSPQIYDSIFTGKSEVKLETNRKKLTVFFSDIKGFTELTDRLEPEALSSVLNHYLDEMSQIALKHGGTIDKFVGDAILIFFGDPETRGEQEDALACVKMAIEMRQRMVSLRREWQKQGITSPLKIRIGVNSGYCNVGNFGSSNRLDYTIVGGHVNLASRLESHANDDEILISDETHALIHEQVECEKRDTIEVKGISYPIQTYQVKGLIVGDKGNTTLHEHSDGFELYLDLKTANKNDVKNALREAIVKLSG